MATHLAAHFSAPNTKYFVRVLELVLALSMMGLISFSLVFLLAVIFRNSSLLDLGKVIFLGSGAGFFFVTGIGHRVAGRMLKVLGCWAVTANLLINMMTTEAELGSVASCLGFVGIVVALFPRAR
jgi:hypothetical protein